MIKSIIIDDEEDSRKTLNILLGSYFPEIKISRICDSAAEGLEAIKSIQPEFGISGYPNAADVRVRPVKTSFAGFF
jgi:DNA-binding LytR/AlgR family response regulator